MRLNRVFVDAPLTSGTLIELPAAAALHLAKVLRARGGDEIVLFTGDGREFAASVESIRGSRVTAAVGEARAVNCESPLAVTLVQCMARADRMDVIVQKTTELGVARIVPVLSRRSVVRLDAAQGASKLEHWRAIAVAACEQCGRNRLPAIDLPRPLLHHLGEAPPPGPRLVLDPDAPGRDAAVDIGASVEIAIGPEGGFDPEELEAFRVAGFERVALGPRVLRTETAAIAALAWLQGRYGDL
ncbi:MAG TPA: 16S rRNA (uracil(1498)-N(3))-methyltransferase [Steroidobacteraceae bacterium]|jgi:16S rRNA (uracil1498-N3)-methyltransferase|nr:16S rRNA (uracil(1498)-N(3))-methyltransferase [Steroidobacteraceae bacterium]